MGLLTAPKTKLDPLTVASQLREAGMCAGKIEFTPDGGVTLYDVQSQESVDARYAKDAAQREKEMTVKLIQFGVQLGLMLASGSGLLGRYSFLAR